MRTSAILTIIISLFLSTAPVSAAVTTSSTQATTSTTASSTLCTTLTKTLKYKTSKDSTTGGEVSKLQNFFKAQGLYKAIPNGIFGSLTLKTVKSFQKKYGLRVTGQVDSKTRTKIRQLSCGSGSSVGSTSDTAKSTKTTTGKEKTTKTTTSSKGGSGGGSSSGGVVSVPVINPIPATTTTSGIPIVSQFIVDPLHTYTDQLATSSYSFAPSTMNYPGASSVKPFTGIDPYMLNIKGSSTIYKFGGTPRTYDFSGDVPFVNPVTKVPDPATMQAFDARTASSVTLSGINITNEGIPGRIEKKYGYTMIKYNAGDGPTAGTARTQLNGFAIPPRSHVKWEFAVSFGANDSENNWFLTPPKKSPVLFWQTKTRAIGNPSMALIVDTDPNDPNDSLKISFNMRQGTSTGIINAGNIGGIKRNTINYITVETFLDEREIVDGGLGLTRVWVNGKLIVDRFGPNLGSVAHNPILPSNDFSYNWSPGVYLYMEGLPYAHSRASFWKTARMFVYPSSLTALPSTAKVLGASTDTPQCIQLVQNLHRGMESSQVTLLQNFLHEQGFLEVPATGFYGDKTVSAVNNYQTSNSIKQTGMVYELTRDSIAKQSCQN